LREKHLHEPLPLLSSAAPEIGPFFDDVLVKATAKNPIDRYQTVGSLIRALEKANDKADVAERMTRRKRAVEALDVAQGRVSRGDYATNEILEVIDLALEEYPGYSDALRLRGRVKLNQRLFSDALADYEQAYKQERGTSSEAGLDYLQALKQATGYLWEQQDYQAALKHCKAIKRVVDESCQNGQPRQSWQELWSDVVQVHYDAGIQAYNAVDVAQIPQAIAVMDREIEALEALGASDEAESFRDKLKVLHIKIRYHEGLAAFAGGNPDDIPSAITALTGQIQVLEALEADQETRDLHDKLRLLQIKVHYDAGIEAYATGDLDEIPRTIETLKTEIDALETLEAHREAQAFRDKLKVLHIKISYHKGNTAFADGSPDDTGRAIAVLVRQIQALEALDAEQESQDLCEKLKLLEIKHHYNRGQKIFKEGEAGNLTDTIQRLEIEIDSLEILKAEIESQDLRNKLRILLVKAHYTTAIQEYQEAEHSEDFSDAIAVLEHQIDALAGLEAHREIIDLEEKLRSLRIKGEKAEKYNIVRELMAEQEYAAALASLDSEFIRAGDYEYRDVARLLWGLVFANKNNGQLPLEWCMSVQRQKKLAKLHNLNKYSIPLALVVAVILGGIIAPQLENLPGLPIVMVIAFVLLLVYFAFYVWAYYLGP
jgi:hypothetical protein